MNAARTAGRSRLATYFHVHLVSDSTGETLNAMAKAVVARFDGVIPIEHIYALVGSDRQMERVLAEIASAPGVVLHTLVDRALRADELGEAVLSPAQMPEFVLAHSDSLEASGFVQHLKLPHYVDFQSELELVRKMRAAATAQPITHEEDAA